MCVHFTFLHAVSHLQVLFDYQTDIKLNSEHKGYYDLFLSHCGVTMWVRVCAAYVCISEWVYNVEWMRGCVWVGGSCRSTYNSSEERERERDDEAIKTFSIQDFPYMFELQSYISKTSYTVHPTHLLGVLRSGFLRPITESSICQIDPITDTDLFIM